MQLLRFCFQCLLLVSIHSTLSAQNQNNFWAYGFGAGIDFNSTPPSFVGGIAMYSSEGAASIANSNTGELLFYTNGVTVWDASNNPMPNGDGLLGGTPELLSSTTAAIICEKPGSEGDYYIFTIDEQSSNNGVRFSVVDMELNGGMGDIVAGQKNIPVLTTNSEKMCVAPNAQGTGFWLITHNGSDTYYAFSITSAGVSSTPVTSLIGPYQVNGAGFMKISPQLDRIAVTNLFFQNAEVFDFNRSTGVISNPVVIDSPFVGAAGGPYGIEFSCSGDFLYVSDGSSVKQFNLTAGSESDIIASAYSVTSNSFSCYGLQLGPDRKIYISNGALDVIENPDVAGAGCGYSANAIANQTSGGGWGLPQWNFRVGDDPLVCEACQINLSITSSTTGCGNQTEYTITANGAGPFTFEIPALGLSNTTGTFVLGSGNYQVEVTDAAGCSSSTEFTNSTGTSCPQDFDSDFVVGVTDLQLFNAAYGCAGDCCPYDLTNDNAVSVADLLVFITAFGDYCE